MSNVAYTLFIWLIGVCISPILIFFIDESVVGSDYLTIYALFIIFGGLLSIPTQIVFMLIFIFGIRESFHTTTSIKTATQITVVVLILLQFYVVSYLLGGLNMDKLNTDFVLMILSYLVTMSAAVWLLKIKTDKKTEVEWDDDVL